MLIWRIDVQLQGEKYSGRSNAPGLDQAKGSMDYSSIKGIIWHHCLSTAGLQPHATPSAS